jgi:hypothetical protein
LPGREDAFTPLLCVDTGTLSAPGTSIGAGWFIQDDGLVWHNGAADEHDQTGYDVDESVDRDESR